MSSPAALPHITPQLNAARNQDHTSPNSNFLYKHAYHKHYTNYYRQSERRK